MRGPAVSLFPVTGPDALVRIRACYDRLLSEFGPQGWWPGEGAFEVVVGSVLTQNTSWKNVETALERLRATGAMSPESMSALPRGRLEELIRAAGFWRRKAHTLTELVQIAGGTSRGLEALLSRPADELENTLLAVRGVGPETAESILLYGAGYPRFVLDTYTWRFVLRHRLATRRTPRSKVRIAFEEALGRSVPALNECHALMVKLGKTHCRPLPVCDGCPLAWDVPAGPLPHRGAEGP